MQDDEYGVHPERKSVKLFTDRDIERFWSKVNREGFVVDQSNPSYAGIGKCWDWTLGLFASGYGQFKAAGRPHRAHRIMWELEFGDIPEGLLICHRCDRKSCVNPDHLFLGTNRDNAQDCRAKGRLNTPTGDRCGARTKPESRPRGETHGMRKNPLAASRGDAHYSRRTPEIMPRGANHVNSKLTDVSVLEIRERYAAGGVSMKALGRQFGVEASVIGVVVRYEGWTHAGGPKTVKGNGRTKHRMLNDAVVREIRATYNKKAGVTMKVLGDKFGVGQNAIHKVLKRATWGHVP